MKRKLIYIFWCWLSSILLFMACDDMEDKPFTSGIIGDPTETGTAELYVLCEGLFNQNNSSLARFSFGNQQMVRDYFKAVNHRGLGDTANDMAIYGSKVYVVVNISSTVEVIDFRTGTSLKQIQMQAENGVQSAVFENGALRIEYAAGCAYLDGEELHLTPIEYKLLCLLSQNAGKVLTHTFITQKIWGSSWENDIASLRVFMATLRKKLEKNGEQTQYIQTHIGVGYRMLKVE